MRRHGQEKQLSALERRRQLPLRGRPNQTRAPAPPLLSTARRTSPASRLPGPVAGPDGGRGERREGVEHVSARRDGAHAVQLARLGGGTARSGGEGDHVLKLVDLHMHVTRRPPKRHAAVYCDWATRRVGDTEIRSNCATPAERVGSCMCRWRRRRSGPQPAKARSRRNHGQPAKRIENIGRRNRACCTGLRRVEGLAGRAPRGRRGLGPRRR